ncbi:MAG TPA: cytochrome c-type biogenesis protein, partial [Rhizomicrobium sp.]|nr:cytochrome c-type biogenesis protein [Rhizomicrobium sp.]
KRLIFSLLLAASMGSTAIAVPVADTFSDPTMETRARALQRQLRCLVCQGESIDESQAPLAAELRHLVRQQMAQGKSDTQIRQFLVTRYGDFILMRPPLQPDTYFLWLLPFVVLLGAGGVAYWVIRRSKPVNSGTL